MKTLTPDDFTKPSPGVWTWDQTHQTRPHPLLIQGSVERGLDEGFAAAFESVGALLEGIESRHVHGWIYQAVRPIGAPPEPKGPPPRLIFKLVTMLHPKIRRRIRRASTVWEEKPWKDASRRWDERERVHRRTLLELQRVLDRASTTEELVGRVRQTLDLTQTILRDHFIESVPGGIPIGDLFARAEDLGIPPTRSAGVLAGASTETARPTRMMLAILDALRDAGDLQLLERTDPAGVVEDLKEHATASQAMRTYLDEYGYRALDMHIDTSETLIERPDIVVSTLRGLRDVGDHIPDAEVGLTTAADLREELPESVHDWWDDAVAQARDALAHRETSANFAAWGFGLVRLYAVRLGKRLHAEGFLRRPDDVFHLRASELDDVPDPAEVQRRRASHEAAATCVPPRVLGTPAEPPPPEWLPDPVARLERAVQAYVSRFDATPDLKPTAELRGLGVSPGVVAGPVFLLEDFDQLDSVPPGCILVTKSTNPTLNPVLPIIGGLVTELGGLICHAAIMSRELGFPGIVGCPDATSRIEHGSRVEIDGTTGEVRLLEGGGAESNEEAKVAFEAVEYEPHAPKGEGRWVPLSEAGNVDRFGGKAARLARAVSAGHRVPNGVALDVDFVEAVAAGDTEHVERLAEALADLEGPLAVRSSAPAEDGSAASFAGMHHTELGVAPEDVAAAVANVWRSGVSPAAQAYRARLGIEGRPRMAVLIQELVPADASGVRFGRDPVTGVDERIVEYAFGLGALVVDGKVKPTRVRLSSDGEVLERVDGETPIKLVPSEGGGVEEVPVSGEEAANHPIQNGLLQSVHALGESCDALFGRAQDVEWAVQDGNVWLLQSRPVTTGDTV